MPSLLDFSWGKDSKAVSMLVKTSGETDNRPIGRLEEDFSRILTKAREVKVDGVYREVFARARTHESKLWLIRDYVLQSDSNPTRSAWFKEAIMSLNSPQVRSDRRRKTPNQLKTIITRIKADRPNIPQVDICLTLDRKGVLLPARWMSSDDRRWLPAFRSTKFKKDIKSYFSKIKPT